MIPSRTNQMLNFEDAFKKGHHISNNDIPTLMQCTNIKYSHTSWYVSVYCDIKVVQHVVNNIVNINEPEDGSSRVTLLYNVSYQNSVGFVCDYSANVNYVLNNGYINKDTIGAIRDYCSLMGTPIVTQKTRTIGELVNYLTDVSLGKFTGFYNVEKYYYMIHTMLLIMKNQRLVPSAVVKHLILPFVYQ